MGHQNINWETEGQYYNSICVLARNIQLHQLNFVMSNFSFSCLSNVSRDSLSPYAWVVDHPGDAGFNGKVGNGYAVAIIMLLFLLVGLPWNIMVIAMILHKRLYTQPTVILMLNLTITNLLLCIFVMPFHIISGFAGEYVFGSSDYVRCCVCQTGLLNTVLLAVSIHTVSLMSVDRFIYLKRPILYSSIVTPKRMTVAIALVWCVCIAISIPPLFGFGSILFSFTVVSCVAYFVGQSHLVPNYSYMLLLLIELLVPIIVVFVMYIWILCIARKNIIQNYNRTKDTMSEGADQNQQRKQFRLVQVFGAIFTAIIVTWLPIIICYIVAAIRGRLPTVMYSIAYLSLLSETTIHPVIEAILIRDILGTQCGRG